MKKILWVSRHQPLDSQIKELKKKFGEDCRIIIDGDPFSSASEIVKRFYKSGADELMLIAPLSVCRAICEAGIKPLWAVMIRTNEEWSEVQGNGKREQLDKKERYYKFVKFKRLEGIDVRLVDL